MDAVWLSLESLVVLAEVFPWTQMGQHPSKPGAAGAAWWLMAVIPRTLSSSEQKTMELNKSEVIKPFDAEQIAPPLYAGINV